VQDKRYSRFIEQVKLQYSCTEHGLVPSIGIINLVYRAGDKNDFHREPETGVPFGVNFSLEAQRWKATDEATI
jgi:hypothetical protein